MDDIVSKLYLPDEGGGYSERRALVAVPESIGGSRVSARFRLAPATLASHVRFDPAAMPGVGALYRIEWALQGGATDNRLIFGAEQLRDVARVVQGVELPPDRSGSLAFWAVNGDPQIELAWPAAFAQTEDGIEVVLDWSFEVLAPEENEELARGLLGRLGYAPPGPEVQEPAPPSAVDLLSERVQELFARIEGLAGSAALAEQQRDELADRLEQAEALDRLQGEQAQALGGKLSDLSDRLERQEEQLLLKQTALEHNGALLEHLQHRLHELEQQSPDNLALRRRELRRRRLQHWRRQASAWVDFVRSYRLIAEPFGDLERLGDGNPARWRATGVDPRFMLRWKGPGPSAGWYLFDLRCRPAENVNFADPCLYVDYGGGMSEETRILLTLEASKLRQLCLVKFDGDVTALRFDPSIHPCDFELGSLRLRKLSSPEVAMRMAGAGLAQLRQSNGAVTRALMDAWNVFRKEGFAGVGQRLRQFAEASSGRHDYDKWVRCFDTLTESDRQRARALIAAMPRRPTFSIVMPVYNTPEQWLVLCLDSVLRQLYPDWELCIADDASTAPHVRPILERYAAQDARIKLCFREKNGHIVAASNSALELVGGEYVVLLDHDDELAEHALFMCADALNARPGIKLIYSDEDKIDEHGRRFDPYFKPDWNPDLFRSHNMISHLGVYATELVRSVGGFRKGYEGSQDYDLALRCIETLRADEIEHIPHVLYHWRAIPGSTALTSDAKSYARSAGVRALDDHFARRGIAATVEETTGGNYRVSYSLPADPPLVSLVIPTRDRVDLLRVCVDSLLERTDYRHFEIIVVNNQSQEPQTLAYFEQIRRDERVRVLDYDEPFSYSAINNFAVAQARGEIVGLVNNDIEVIDAHWLTEMVSHAVRPEIGAVGAMLYYPDDRIQHAGVIVGLGGVAGHAYAGKPRRYQGQMNRACVVQNLSSVTAACLLLRKSIYEEVGGLDEELRVAFNDTDFCLRIRERGYRNLWTPWAQLYHYESASRGREDSPEKLARFNSEVDFMHRRWGATIQRDPAYSPNLSLTIESFALAWPPRVLYPFRTEASVA